MSQRVDVAVWGARGMIGQQYMHLLQAHSWFCAHPVESLSEARRYPLIFSALPHEAAKEWEPQLVAAGCGVISSASTHRQTAHIPLFIPEVNPEHLSLIDRKRGWIIAKPNCTVQTFLLPLTPLHHQFQVTHLHITSLQALSGAGKKGLEDPLLKHSVACHIAEEEEKCMGEPKKIWGTLHATGVTEASVDIFAQCNRVPVTHGHTVCISARFAHPPTREQVLHCWQNFTPLALPSSAPLLIDYQENAILQSNHDMSVTCGRLRTSSHYDIHFVACAHNLIRGGAGTGILIAEYLYQHEFPCVIDT